MRIRDGHSKHQDNFVKPDKKRTVGKCVVFCGQVVRRVEGKVGRVIDGCERVGKIMRCLYCPNCAST